MHRRQPEAKQDHRRALARITNTRYTVHVNGTPYVFARITSKWVYKSLMPAEVFAELRARRQAGTKLHQWLTDGSKDAVLDRIEAITMLADTSTNLLDFEARCQIAFGTPRAVSDRLSIRGVTATHCFPSKARNSAGQSKAAPRGRQHPRGLPQPFHGRTIMASGSVKQRVMAGEAVVAEVDGDVVTLRLGERPRFFTESENPRLAPYENQSVQYIREAIEGADAVAELLMTDAIHAAQVQSKDGYAYQPPSGLVAEGLHIALSRCSAMLEGGWSAWPVSDPEVRSPKRPTRLSAGLLCVHGSGDDLGVVDVSGLAHAPTLPPEKPEEGPRLNWSWGLTETQSMA